MRSTLLSPIQRSGLSLPTSAVRPCSLARRPTLEGTSPTTLRSGPRWSSSQGLRRIDAAERSINPVRRKCLLLAHRVNSRQRSTSAAFGAKRTLTEPRLQKADLWSTRPRLGTRFLIPQNFGSRMFNKWGHKRGHHPPSHPVPDNKRVKSKKKNFPKDFGKGGPS